MVTLGLVVKLVAKPGKEQAVVKFLEEAQVLAQAEPFMPAWFALRAAHNIFYIVDAFPDETGREWHLSGAIANELRKQAADLFAEPPHIEKVDVIAAKLPRH